MQTYSVKAEKRDKLLRSLSLLKYWSSRTCDHRLFAVINSLVRIFSACHWRQIGDSSEIRL